MIDSPVAHESSVQRPGVGHQVGSAVVGNHERGALLSGASTPGGTRRGRRPDQGTSGTTRSRSPRPSKPSAGGVSRQPSHCPPASMRAGACPRRSHTHGSRPPPADGPTGQTATPRLVGFWPAERIGFSGGVTDRGPEDGRGRDDVHGGSRRPWRTWSPVAATPLATCHSLLWGTLQHFAGPGSGAQARSNTGLARIDQETALIPTARLGTIGSTPPRPWSAQSINPLHTRRKRY